MLSAIKYEDIAIKYEDILVGDTIKVVITHGASGTRQETTLTVAQKKVTYSGEQVLIDSSDMYLYVSPKAAEKVELYLVERKISKEQHELAREMLDLYCSLDDQNMNRMKRMLALVKNLDLTKRQHHDMMS